MDEEEIRRQVREMAAQGIDGFFIHPRQGLSAPYPSRAFFDRVEAAIDEAGRRGRCRPRDGGCSRFPCRRSSPASSTGDTPPTC